MLIATKTPVTEIPKRAMLDLEEIGGGGFADAYAVLALTEPTMTGHLLVVELEGQLTSLEVPTGTRVPVITYAASNALETQR